MAAIAFLYLTIDMAKVLLLGHKVFLGFFFTTSDTQSPDTGSTTRAISVISGEMLSIMTVHR